jgi:hypothetical protein
LLNPPAHGDAAARTNRHGLEAIAIVGTMHRHAAIGLVDRNDLGLEADQISDLARERSFPPNQTLPD